MTPDASAVGHRLSIAIGTYPHTRALKADLRTLSSVPVDFADVEPINRAFAPMVREQRFDICELAIATFLQAKAHGCPIVLLPAATACRFQEAALICRMRDRSITGPRDLIGKRVGVRSYSQTTAVWLRGILHDDFGVMPQDILWTVTEPAHVREFVDPDFVRSAAGADLLALLSQDQLDAVIVGNDKPESAELRPVFPDVGQAAARFQRVHGFEPVNHVIVARRSFVQSMPEAAVAFLDAIEASYGAADADAARVPPLGRRDLQPSLDLALRYAGEQHLMPRPLSADEIWDGLTQIEPQLQERWP